VRAEVLTLVDRELRSRIIQKNIYLGVKLTARGAKETLHISEIALFRATPTKAHPRSLRTPQNTRRLSAWGGAARRWVEPALTRRWSTLVERESLNGATAQDAPRCKRRALF